MDAELFRRALESRLADVNTVTMGQVQAYDPTTQTADVQPMIRFPLRDVDGVVKVNEDLPILPNVPVLFPRGGSAHWIAWPLEKGDTVTLLFLTRSIQQWRRTGQLSDPGDLRLHHLGNALALPAGGPNASALPLAGVTGLVLESASIKLGADAADAVALAPGVAAWIDAIVTAVASAPGGSIVVPPPGPSLTATGDPLVYASKVMAK